MRKLIKKILKGYTLVEIMVAMSIFLIIMYLSASMMGSYGTPALLTQANILINTQARQAAEKITWELMQASSSRIVVDNSSSIRFNLPLEYANGTLNRSSGGDLQWGDKYSLGFWINYYWNATTQNITRRILNIAYTPQAGKNLTIATNITNFTVQQNLTRYQFNVTASINNYMGRPLPSYINNSIDFAVTPQN
jgi:prepilin-type N-terminal cleavage/methylation domain-containing protein